MADGTWRTGADRDTVIRRFFWGGVLLFGPFLGFALATCRDMWNHSTVEKFLVFAACALIAGPVWGLATGWTFWLWLQRQRREQTRRHTA